MVLFNNSSYPNQKDGEGESDEIVIDNAIVGGFDDSDLINNQEVEDDTDDYSEEEDEDDLLGEEDEDVDYDTFDDIDEL